MTNLFINQGVAESIKIYRLFDALMVREEKILLSAIKQYSLSSIWNFNCEVPEEGQEPLQFDWEFAGSQDLVFRLEKDELTRIYKDLVVLGDRRTPVETHLMKSILKKLKEMIIRTPKSYVGDVLFATKIKRIAAITTIKMMRDLVGLAAVGIKFRKTYKPIKKEVAKRSYNKAELIKGITISTIAFSYGIYICTNCKKLFSEEDKDKICCKRSLALHKVKRVRRFKCLTCGKSYQKGGLCYCKVPVHTPEIEGPNTLTIMPREKGAFIEMY
jgi:DNA-directed RNA polymerase subunit RPC12/RpoP